MFYRSSNTFKRYLTIASVVVFFIVTAYIISWNVMYKPMVDNIEAQFMSFSYIDKDLNVVTYKKDPMSIPMFGLIKSNRYIRKMINEYRQIEDTVNSKKTSATSEEMATYGLYTHAIQRFIELEIPCEGMFIKSPWEAAQKAIKNKTEYPAFNNAVIMVTIWGISFVTTIVMIFLL